MSASFAATGSGAASFLFSGAVLSAFAAGFTTAPPVSCNQ